MKAWFLRLCLGLLLLSVVACGKKEEAKPGKATNNDPNFKPDTPPAPPRPPPPPPLPSRKP
jgi:hypothetical protein